MAEKNKRSLKHETPMIFGAWNYKVLAIGLILVIAGFTAMYLENKVDGVISLFISPIVILAGYVTVIFAIMMHGSEADQGEQHGAG